MKPRPDVELDAQMMAAHAQGRIHAFRLKRRMTLGEVYYRARWLTRQPDDYRAQVKQRLHEILERASQQA